MPMKRVLSPLLITFFLLLADRFAKTWFLASENHVFDSRFFSLFPYRNSGIAFSIPLPRFFILLLTGAILLALGFFLLTSLRHAFQKPSPFSKPQYFSLLGLLLLFAGAFSNFYDRLVQGFVMDYIQLLFPWWIFNIADVMIFGGIVMLFLYGKKDV